MKTTAKVLVLILVLALFAAMAMGSGSKKTDDVKEPSSVTSGAEDTGTKSEEASPSAPGSSAGPSDTDAQSAAGSDANEVSLEESVAFDQDGIKITVKGFSLKGTFGPEIKLLIENDSEASVTVQARNASVNGYMIDTMLSADVAPGKKANDTLRLMRSDLELAGITTVADIEFSFHIFNSDTWDAVCDSDMISLRTSAAEGYTYTFDDSGNSVCNVDGVEITVKGLSESGSWLGPAVIVYVSNSGGRDITVQARDVSVNGFMVSSVFSCDVLSGKHAVDAVTFLSSDLKDNDIEKIEDLELSFHVFDMSSWETVFDTEPVVMHFD